MAYIYICTHICIYVYMYICVCICICICIYMCICICVCMCMVCVCVYVYVYVCVYVYVYAYIYIYIVMYIYIYRERERDTAHFHTRRSTKRAHCYRKPCRWHASRRASSGFSINTGKRARRWSFDLSKGMLDSRQAMALGSGTLPSKFLGLKSSELTAWQIHVVRIFTTGTKNPASRDRGTSLCLGEIHPLETRTCSDQTQDVLNATLRNLPAVHKLSTAGRMLLQTCAKSPQALLAPTRTRRDRGPALVL